jgi:hypothetical protein
MFASRRPRLFRANSHFVRATQPARRGTSRYRPVLEFLEDRVAPASLQVVQGAIALVPDGEPTHRADVTNLFPSPTYQSVNSGDGVFLDFPFPHTTPASSTVVITPRTVDPGADPTDPSTPKTPGAIELDGFASAANFEYHAATVAQIGSTDFGSPMTLEVVGDPGAAYQVGISAFAFDGAFKINPNGAGTGTFATKVAVTVNGQTTTLIDDTFSDLNQGFGNRPNGSTHFVLATGQTFQLIIEHSGIAHADGFGVSAQTDVNVGLSVNKVDAKPNLAVENLDWDKGSLDVKYNVDLAGLQPDIAFPAKTPFVLYWFSEKNQRAQEAYRFTMDKSDDRTDGVHEFGKFIADKDLIPPPEEALGLALEYDPQGTVTEATKTDNRFVLPFPSLYGHKFIHMTPVNPSTSGPSAELGPFLQDVHVTVPFTATVDSQLDPNLLQLSFFFTGGQTAVGEFDGKDTWVTQQDVGLFQPSNDQIGAAIVHWGPVKLGVAAYHLALQNQIDWELQANLPKGTVSANDVRFLHDPDGKLKVSGVTIMGVVNDLPDIYASKLKSVEVGGKKFDITYTPTDHLHGTFAFKDDLANILPVGNNPVKLLLDSQNYPGDPEQDLQVVQTPNWLLQDQTRSYDPDTGAYLFPAGAPGFKYEKKTDVLITELNNLVELTPELSVTAPLDVGPGQPDPQFALNDLTAKVQVLDKVLYDKTVDVKKIKVEGMLDRTTLDFTTLILSGTLFNVDKTALFSKDIDLKLRWPAHPGIAAVIHAHVDVSGSMSADAKLTIKRDPKGSLVFDDAGDKDNVGTFVHLNLKATVKLTLTTALEVLVFDVSGPEVTASADFTFDGTAHFAGPLLHPMFTDRSAFEALLTVTYKYRFTKNENEKKYDGGGTFGPISLFSSDPEDEEEDTGEQLEGQNDPNAASNGDNSGSNGSNNGSNNTSNGTGNNADSSSGTNGKPDAPTGGNTGSSSNTDPGPGGDPTAEGDPTAGAGDADQPITLPLPSVLTVAPQPPDEVAAFMSGAGKQLPPVPLDLVFATDGAVAAVECDNLADGPLEHAAVDAALPGVNGTWPVLGAAALMAVTAESWQLPHCRRPWRRGTIPGKR